MNSGDDKVIRITSETYKKIQRAKIRKRESIDSVITRLFRENQLAERSLKGNFQDPETIKAFGKVMVDYLKSEFEIKPRMT